jgi:glutamate carboxypeptidase
MIEMQALLRQLVETESPSHDKAAVERVGAIVAQAAGSLGAAIQFIPNEATGDHVIARWDGGGDGILMLCHMDTVFPVGTLAKMPFREAEGKCYGPGVLDMKSGIVISLAALAQLMKSNASLPHAITLLCTSDEEIGSPSSRTLIEQLARSSALVLVMEAALPDGSLKTWRKGVGEFELRVTGRAAHAGGAHAEGRNAIEELAHQVLAIQKLTDYEVGTTLNVGVVQGGTVSNVVPEHALAQVDVRVSQPDEWGRIESAMRSLRPVLEGTAVQVQGALNRPPMPFDERAQITFTRAQEIAARLGVQLQAGGSGGGSDANFVAPLGIPVLDGLGAIGDGYHSEREYILAASLPERATLLAALLREW